MHNSEFQKEQIPLVSVIMPVRNGAGTIRKAVLSVLEQDVPLELIIIDDCSEDHPEAVLGELLFHTGVRIINNKKNLGASGSRNLGVREARGTWIAFLDADDWWEKDKLRLQMDLLEKTGAVLCSTARELVTPDGSLTGRIIPVREKITYRNLLTHNSINCSSVVVRRDVMREFPMEHEDSHEDYISWLGILRKYGYSVAVNRPLLKYRVSNSGKSGAKGKSAWMTYKAYRYAGLGPLGASACFCAYAFNGARKYLLSYFRRK